MTLQVSCLSFRQPYAGLILNGVKTVETRWRPVLSALENSTLAIHVAQKEWEGEEWRGMLTDVWRMNSTQIEYILESGERFGRGVVAGLVDVGVTWQCSGSEDALTELERAAVLTGLAEKHLTRLSNPRWLDQPLYARGHKDIWNVEIPVELLPSSSTQSNTHW
ncbi:protein EOLA1 [Aplochiton taeniatus]